MTERPAFDAPSAASREATTAVLDRPEPVPDRGLSGFYDPDSCDFEAGDQDPYDWANLAVSVEPEATVPAGGR